MKLDKSIGNWVIPGHNTKVMEATPLDDLAYHLYCRYVEKSQKGYENDLAMLSQYAFVFYGTQLDESLREGLDHFYNEARNVIRNEKLKKLVNGIG